MGFTELGRRLRILREAELANIVSNILDAHSDLLVEIQKYQLYAGQNAVGEQLAPSYLDDPYFKDQAAAQRYADWKATLGQDRSNPIYPKKSKDIPNLIVTGTLVYNTIFASVSPKELIISARTSILSKLEGKYKEPFGINQLGWDYYSKKYLIPELKERVQKFLAQ